MRCRITEGPGKNEKNETSDAVWLQNTLEVPIAYDYLLLMTTLCL